MEFSAGDQSSPLIEDAELLQLTVRDGNLTQEERREIERHPLESFRILQHIPFTANFSRLMTMIQQHHERMDGSGYPMRLCGEEIILQGRILAITDIYDAITQERHYKPALARHEALKVLDQEAARGRIDPRLAELFIGHIEQIEERAGRRRRDAGARRCLWPPNVGLTAG
jgi:HD-GYP domain-containing protein (c-di-GMP phosphodiesterase class II)